MTHSVEHSDLSGGRWFKSSFSSSNGNCVEVAFFKSSFSSSNGSCVEVAYCECDTVAVRDSKDRSGPKLLFTAEEWSKFVEGVRNKSIRR